MNNQDYNSVYFTTHELCLGATLLSLGFNLDSIDKSDPKKATFIFKRDPALDQTSQKFWAKKLLIEPISFFEAQRYLKSRLYGGGDG